MLYDTKGGIPTEINVAEKAYKVGALLAGGGGVVILDDGIYWLSCDCHAYESHYCCFFYDCKVHSKMDHIHSTQAREQRRNGQQQALNSSCTLNHSSGDTGLERVLELSCN